MLMDENQRKSSSSVPEGEEVDNSNNNFRKARLDVVMNFPPHDSPLLYFPPIPDITKVPEPKPHKKPPIAGYDMKTLRKQIEFLTAEIAERTETRDLLFRQNEQLWDYTQTLVGAGQANVDIMKDHVENVLRELHAMDLERRAIADKLEMVQNSDEIMKNLDRELAELKIKGVTAKTLREEASRALQQAAQRKAELEESLTIQQNKLTEMEKDFEEAKWEQREEDAIEAADRFFSTNKAVLRSAYRRFKVAVYTRMQYAEGSRVLSSVYSSVLQNHVIYTWRRVRMCSVLRKKNILLRSLRLRAEYFSQWKVHNALERLCVARHRKKLILGCFGAWKTFLQDAKLTQKADALHVTFLEKRILRAVMRAWKSKTHFLEWSSRSLQLLEIRAIKYFVRKVIHAWHVAVKGEKEKAINAVRGTLIVRIKYHFKAWRSVCLLLWRTRARLLRRFFSRARELVVSAYARQGFKAHAMKLWIGLRKRWCVHKWANRLRQAQRARRYNNNNGYDDNSNKNNKAVRFVSGVAPLALHTSLLLHKHRKTVRTFFLSFLKRSSVLRRLDIQLCRGESFFNHKVLKVTWRFWLASSRARRKMRARRVRIVCERMFRAWAFFVPLHKKEKKIVKAEQAVLSLSRTSRKRMCFQSWHSFIHRTRTLRRLEDIVLSSSHLHSQRRVMQQWRLRFGRELAWKLKEAAIEKSRTNSLQELKRKQVEDLERENEKLSSWISELEATLISTQDAIDRQEEELSKLELEVEVAERRRQKELAELEASRTLLIETQAERDRLRDVEAVLLADKKNHELREKEREAEAKKRTDALHTQLAELRKEVQEARAQKYVVERIAEEQVNDSQRQLDAVLQKVAEAEAALEAKQLTLRSMTEQKQAMNAQLQAIKTRFDEAQREGQRLAEEEAASLRKKQASVRVLRTETGLAEARVMQLRELVKEERERRRIAHYDEVKNREIDESRELARMTNAVAQSFYQDHSTHLFSDTHIGSGNRRWTSEAYDSYDPNNSTKIGGDVAGDPPASFSSYHSDIDYTSDDYEPV